MKKFTPISGEKDQSELTFTGLKPADAQLTSKNFTDCLFRNCDFTGGQLRFCRFRNCRFESCNLSLLKAPASAFQGCVFKDSKLTGMNWTEADWPKINISGPLEFRSCVLSDCSFLGLPLAGTVIKDCFAKGTDFREADLSGADLSGTDLPGALFHKANLTGADLSTARNYAINVKESPVKGAKFSLPEAMSLLEHLDIRLV